LPDPNVPATAIDRAPVEPGNVTLTRDDHDRVLAKLEQLEFRNQEQSLEIERLRGGAEAARAQLIRPYAWAVLWFLSVYGAVVAIILFLQGFRFLGFHFNDTVMGVVVGSTAVSAIGLVRIVVRGLFPSRGG